jgi:hypothetical protein
MHLCTQFGVVRRRPFQTKDNPRGRLFAIPNSVQKCVSEEKKTQNSCQSIATYGVSLGVQLCLWEHICWKILGPSWKCCCLGFQYLCLWLDWIIGKCLLNFGSNSKFSCPQIIWTKSIILLSEIESMKKLASLPCPPSSRSLLLQQHFQTGFLNYLVTYIWEEGHKQKNTLWETAV